MNQAKSGFKWLFNIDGVILKPRIQNFSENQNHVCSSHVKIKTSYEVIILYTTYEVFISPRMNIRGFDFKKNSRYEVLI